MPPANTNVNGATAYLGRRILLWGGGGKSTLSPELGTKLELPVVELDALWHMPGWVQREPVEFRALTRDTLDVFEDGWIADGQYVGALGGDLLEQIDTLIWLQLPFHTTFWRVFKRSVQRALDKERICGDNTESWRQTFLSRDSLLLYLLNRRLFHHGESQGIQERLLQEHGSQARVIRLESANALDRFYEVNGLVRE
jgi:adenylate kinase family enzyme